MGQGIDQQVRQQLAKAHRVAEHPGRNGQRLLDARLRMGGRDLLDHGGQ